MLVEDLILAAAEHTGDARVVAVSSCEHFRTDKFAKGIQLTRAALNARYDKFPRKESYAQSKLANILFIQEVARRVQCKPVFANSVHPGAVNTEIWGKGATKDLQPPLMARMRM